VEAPSPDLPLSRQEKEEKKEKKEEKPKKKDEPGGPVFKAMFGRGTTIFAFAVLIGSFIMPPNGIGFALCWFKNMTGLPCPGCGLTRSIACITHLHFGEAVHYHPFGPVVYVLAILAVAMKFAGERRRQKLAAVFDRNRRLAGGIYWSVVGAFIVYGLVRLALVVRDPTLFTHV
jgi:hypothetical protein